MNRTEENRKPLIRCLDKRYKLRERNEQKNYEE